MPETVRLLRQEHANIAKLLNVLEHQLALFDQAEPPDYDLLRSVAEYFLSYPDSCHHPKEDVIFQKLKARDSAGTGAIGDLEAEHRKISNSARHLWEAVKNAHEDVEVSREAIHRVIAGFIDSERRHMKMEEEVLFPTALEALSPKDWAEVDARLTDRADPLFGHEVEERFEDLLAHILAWEEEAAAAERASTKDAKRSE